MINYITENSFSLGEKAWRRLITDKLNAFLSSAAITEQVIPDSNVIDFNTTYHHRGLTANTTFTIANNANAKSPVVVAITNTAGNYTVTWPVGIEWGTSGAPTQTVGAETDIYTFIQINGVVYGSVRQ